MDGKSLDTKQEILKNLRKLFLTALPKIKLTWKS